MTILDGSIFIADEFTISKSYPWKDDNGLTATAEFIGTGRSIVKSKVEEIAKVEGYLIEPEAGCEDSSVIPIVIYKVGIKKVRVQRSLHLMKDGRAFIL